MSIPSTDVGRLLLGLRVFVYAGALLRFALHWDDTPHTARYGFVLSAACLIIGLVEVFAQSPRSRTWRILQIYVDIVCITALYVLTGTLESDFFIFYYLPLVGAAQELSLKPRRLVALLAVGGLTTAVIYVAYATQRHDYPRLFASVVLPRSFALVVFALISSRLIKARSALPGALAEIVRATSSATTLDRNLDELLDKAIGLGFDQASVALVDRPMGDIRMVRARGLPPRHLAMSQFRLTDSDIMCSIVQSAKTEAFAAGVRDPRFDARIYEAFGHAQLARVFTPLITGGPNPTVVGLLECGCRRANSDDWVVSMKSQVEQIAREHADAIGSNLTHVLLAAIAQRAIDVIDADSATIHVYQDGCIRYQAGAGRADQVFLEHFPPRVRGIGRDSIKNARPITLDGQQLREGHPELFEHGVRAMTAFPLLNLGAQELRGVLYVHFWKAEGTIRRLFDECIPALSRRRFTNRIIDIEKLFAEQLEGTIQNYLSLRYSADAAERAWQVSLLQNFIQSLASKHASPTLLQEIASGALLYLPECDCVTLYQYFSDRQHFESPPVMAGNFREPDAMKTEVGFEETQGLLAISEARFLADVRAHEELTVRHQTSGRARFVDREAVQSSAQLPLRDQDGETVGVLFLNYRAPHEFTDAERKAIGSFASAAAIAISNGREMDRALKQNQQIQRLQQTINEIKAPFRKREVASQLLDEVTRRVSVASSASLQSVDGNTRKILAAKGFDPHTADPYFTRPISNDEFLAGVLRKRTPTIVSDTAGVEGWDSRRRVLSWIGIPLYSRSACVGLITLDGAEHDTFEHVDRDDLEQFAQHAGMELERAIENDQAYRKIHQLELLREVYERIDARSSMAQLAQAVAERVVNRMQCDQCNVLLRDSSRSPELRAVGSEGLFAKLVRERKYPLCSDDRSPVAQAYFSRQPILTHTQFVGERRHASRSIVAVPIVAGDHAIGVITAEKNRAGFFEEADAIVMRSIAQSTGHAIERDRALKLIQDVGRQILSAADKQEVLQKIVEGVASLTDVDNAAILLRDEAAESGYLTIEYPKVPLPPPRSDGLTTQILATGQVVVIEDTSNTEQRVSSSLREKFKSLIGIPLSAGGDAGGVLFLLSRTHRRFSEAERSVLQSLATHAALALQKARRLEATEYQLKESEKRKVALSNLVRLNEVTSGLFHHILEPVATLKLISGNLEADVYKIAAQVEIASKRANDRQTRRALEKAERECKSALSSVIDLRKYATRTDNLARRVSDSLGNYRQNDVPQTIVSVKEILDEACNIVCSKYRSAVVKRAFEECDTEIETHRSMLAEAIANVITNAVEAVAQRPDPSVRVHGTRASKGLLVRIIDNGVGIDPKDCERLFNHRFTTGKAGKGFGYGLWFSNLVFIANGISPQVESTLGKGTVIVLTFSMTNGDRNGHYPEAS